MKTKLSEIYWPLRVAYGLVPLLAGLDKKRQALFTCESRTQHRIAPLRPATWSERRRLLTSS
jgi:hypothetical protein